MAIEQEKLQVILEAQNRAEGVLKQFGAQLDAITARIDRLTHAAEDSSKRTETAFSRLQSHLQGVAGHIGKMEGSFQAVAGHGSMLGNVFARLGTVLTAVWTSPLGALAGFVSLGVSGLGSILSALGSVIEKVAQTGLAILEWLGRTALEAVEKLSKAFLVLGGVGAAALAYLAGKSLAAAGEMERYEAMLTVLTGSLAEAQDQLARMVEFAAATPFELQGIIEGQMALKAYRIDLGGLEETLTIVGDTASGTGSQLSEVINTLGKLKAGMFETEQVVSALKLTKEDFESKGVIFSGTGEAKNREALFPAAVALVIERYGGMMEKMASTWKTRMSNIADAWFQLKAALGQPIMDTAKAALEGLAGAMGRLQPGLVALGQSFADSFGPTIQTLIEGTTASLDRIVTTLEEIAKSDRFKAIVAGIGAALEYAQRVVAAFIDWLGENWGEIWDWVSDKVGAAADWVAGAIYGLANVIKFLVDSKGAIWDWAHEVMQAMIAIGQTIATSVLTEIEALLKVVADKLPWAAAALGAIRGAIAGGTIGAIAGGPAGAIVGGAIGAVGGGAVGYGGAEWAQDVGRDLVKRERQNIEDWGQKAELGWARFRVGQMQPDSFGSKLGAAWGQGWQGGQGALAGWRENIAGRVGGMGGGGGYEMTGYAMAPLIEDAQEAADTQEAAGRLQMDAAEKIASAVGAGGAGAAGAGAGAGGAAGGVGGAVLSPALARAQLAEAMGDIGTALDQYAAYYWEERDAVEELWRAMQESDTPENIQAVTQAMQERDKAWERIVKLAGAGPGAQAALGRNVPVLAGAAPVPPAEPLPPSVMAGTPVRDAAGNVIGYRKVPWLGPSPSSRDLPGWMGAGEIPTVQAPGATPKGFWDQPPLLSHVEPTFLPEGQSRRLRVEGGPGHQFTIVVRANSINSREDMKQIASDGAKEVVDQWWDEQMDREVTANDFQGG